jgi:hypothetical protein
MIPAPVMLAAKDATTAAAGGSAVTASTAAAIDSISLAIFGVPVSMWVACFSGALFGSTWFPSEAGISLPWAVITNTLAGVFMTALAIHWWALPKPVSAGVGFFISSAPLFFFQLLKGRFQQPPPPPSPPTTGGAESAQP